MLKKQLFFIAITVGIISLSANAQISEGGKPASFNTPSLKKQAMVYSPKMSFSLQKSLSMEKECTAYEFGKVLSFDRRMQDPDFGTKQVDQNGNTIWSAKIESKNAQALGLYFSNFYIPPGAKLFVYSADKNQLIGAFTEKNNSENGLFATELIFGDQLVIEYNEPASVAGLGSFTIDEVLHAFRGVSDLKESSGFGGSGSCEVNVACPEGTGYEKQINSVVRLLIKEGSSSYWCTGTVINNVNNDKTPYVLTADHCASTASAEDLNQWIIYFNYQSTTCSNPTIAPASKTMTGATEIASSSNAGVLGSDFYFVLLNQNIPTDYNAYFMGWDRTGDGSTNGASIHHPQGDIKKISTYTKDLISSTYSSGGFVGFTNGFWEVEWAETVTNWGVTEGGSSGSPIYSQDGFLIGTLTGGWASCSSPTSADYYGKFNYHWDKNGTTNDTQLKPWLDPGNTGTLFLSGTPVGIENPIQQKDEFFTVFPNPSNGQITLRFNAQAIGENYTIRVSNMLGQLILENKLEINYQKSLNLQELGKGVYFLQIIGEKQRQTQKISIR